MRQPRKREILWWVLFGALGLLGSGIVIAYSMQTKLETALQELQKAYEAEQARTKKLTQKADGLLKEMERAQARVEALERGRRASEQEKRKLRAKGAKLKAALQAEQAKTKKVTQNASGLSKAVMEAEARVKSLEKSARASEQEKRKLRAKATKLERALRRLQTAYDSEQARAKKLTQKAEELLKSVEQAQVRVKAPEKSAGAPEQKKGRLQAKGTKLEMALQEMQKAYEAEQAKTKRLTERVEGLLREMEQAQVRVKALEQGRVQAKAMKLETALQELQKAYEAEQVKTGKLTQEMAAMLELVTRLQADLVALHHALGVSYNRLGMNEEALKTFQTALELNPDHAESHFDLARVYIEYLDDSESAARHFRKYVQLRPEARDAERIKGWLMKVEKEIEIKHELKRRREGLF